MNLGLFLRGGLLLRGGACALLLFPANWLAAKLEPETRAPVGMDAGQRAALEHSASASLLGQFRTSTSDFLWMKVEEYTHGGVTLRAMTNDEKKKLAPQVTSTEGVQTGNKSHDGTEITVVPAAENDWRGVFGNIERATQPYEDMQNHHHKEPKEALPLFRLMTISNPKFIQGYVTGAFALATQNRLADAKAFLAEGAKNNPESGELPSAIGAMIASREARDAGEKISADAKNTKFIEAIPYLQHAIDLFAVQDPEKMTEDEKEAQIVAHRLLVIVYRDLGNHPKARRWALEALKLNPGDATASGYFKKFPKQ
jgi:tetratricopeptide (TPR) repeat protein